MDLKRNFATFELLGIDIIGLDTKVKHINIVDQADGLCLYYEARNNQQTERNSKVLSRLLLLSAQVTNFILSLSI